MMNQQDSNNAQPKNKQSQSAKLAIQVKPSNKGDNKKKDPLAAFEKLLSETPRTTQEDRKRAAEKKVQEEIKKKEQFKQKVEANKVIEQQVLNEQVLAIKDQVEDAESKGNIYKTMQSKSLKKESEIKQIKRVKS
jgi:TPP-dependent pyruvate/acetoin dehydrogenase alpha subunit